MTTATRSFTVVMSGPDATAGSTPIFLKKIGMMVPMAVDMVMDTRRAIAVQPETLKA